MAEGKSTLPLIYAMQNCSPTQHKEILKILRAENLSEGMLANIIEIVQKSGGLDYTKKLAESRAEIAAKHLKILPESKYKGSLETMVEFSVNRKH